MARHTGRVSARTVQGWLFLGLLVLLAVLTATGVWLTFRYRPSAAAAWNDVAGLDAGIPPVQLVHRWSAQLSWLVAIALMTVTLVLRIAEADRRQPWGLATAAIPLLLAMTVTGYLLPWDQLALWAVTVGSNFGGVLDAAFDDRVRFLIIGGVEVGQSTYRLWFLIHAAGLSAGLWLITVLLAMRLRAGRDAPPPSSDSSGSA
jgi:quinol-cytochrome oxidoreductase complex cytochrome b subunit